MVLLKPHTDEELLGETIPASHGRLVLFDSHWLRSVLTVKAARPRFAFVYQRLRAVAPCVRLEP